jgi:hypothetical protein
MVEATSVEVLIMQHLFPDEPIRTQVNKAERPKQSKAKGAIDIEPVGLTFAKKIHQKITTEVVPVSKAVEVQPIVFGEDL